MELPAASCMLLSLRTAIRVLVTKQEVLGSTNRLFDFDTTGTA
jgi:hypothetical protein